MALKDTWIDLEDAIQGVEGSGDNASAETINTIAHAVIDLENNVGDFEQFLDSAIALCDMYIEGVK